jgi:hypothetical protein
VVPVIQALMEGADAKEYSSECLFLGWFFEVKKLALSEQKAGYLAPEGMLLEGQMSWPAVPSMKWVAFQSTWIRYLALVL